MYVYRSRHLSRRVVGDDEQCSGGPTVVEPRRLQPPRSELSLARTIVAAPSRPVRLFAVYHQWLTDDLTASPRPPATVFVGQRNRGPTPSSLPSAALPGLLFVAPARSRTYRGTTNREKPFAPGACPDPSSHHRGLLVALTP